MCVNRSSKIPQSDHFYINQENGFCQDFVDCNGFFGLRCRLQVNKSVAILIQSSQSCRNSVQSSIVKCQYNPTKSIPIPAQFGYTQEDCAQHIEILLKTIFGLYLWHTGIITQTPVCQCQSWSHIVFVKGVDVDITSALYLNVYFFTIGRNPENHELQLSRIPH